MTTSRKVCLIDGNLTESLQVGTDLTTHSGPLFFRIRKNAQTLHTVWNYTCMRRFLAIATDKH